MLDSFFHHQDLLVVLAPPRPSMAAAGCCRWRLVVLLLLLVAALLLAPSRCQATRGAQPFRGRPLERGGANHFLGFLPRGPVPPSGPSRQHNSIGAEDQGHP